MNAFEPKPASLPSLLEPYGPSTHGISLAGSVENTRSGRGWGMLADKNGLKAFFHQLLAGSRHRVDAGVDGGGDLAVAPSVASVRCVRLQQNTSSGQLAGRVRSASYPVRLPYESTPVTPETDDCAQCGYRAAAARKRPDSEQGPWRE